MELDELGLKIQKVKGNCTIDELGLKIQKVKGNCMTKENFMKMLDVMEFQFVEDAYINLITGIIADGNNGNIEILRNTIDFN